MTDFRKKSLINISECHLGAKFSDEEHIVGTDELNNFLDIDNFLTIYAALEETRLKFFKDVERNTSYEKIVIFSKIKPCPISDDNIVSNIQISCLCGSPSLALYHTLNNVFTPFLKFEKEQNIHRQLAALQADLRATLMRNLDNSETEDENISYSLVRSLDQEVDYWDRLSASKKDRLTRSYSTTFRDILQPLARDFSIIDALPLNDLEELLERTHNILDDLWRHEPPYPKDRMKHLMDLVANDISQAILKKLEEHDVWLEDFNVTVDLLQQFLSVCTKWLTTCQQLTEIFWPNYSLNPWRNGIHQPTQLVQLVTVLEQILNTRTLHKQLVRLLTPDEQQNLNVQEMFRPFKDLNLIYLDKVGLLKAQKQFEVLLQPAERQVAMKLKKQLSSINANTRQLLYEFSRYSELISRPILRETLQSERTYLLNNLFDYVRGIQSQMNFEQNGMTLRRDTPPVVKEIIYNKQLENRASEVRKVGMKLLDDLNGYQNLEQIVDALLKELKQQHNELFESWTSEIISYINDKSLSLKVSDPVVHFTKQKYMKVNFSPRLVTLISEVRQLRGMGYHIPSVIEETSEQAKKFMKHARILEQIANFHNTIGDRMIPSQQPMMLVSALELSKLVQEQEVVRWGDEKSVENYVNTLKNAVEKLSKENNLLTGHHRHIIDKIQSFENVDLIKDYSKWKELSRYIRNLMTQIEDKGFKNMQNWKNEIDRRLCDVLEQQYLKSLDTLHLYLPEIHTDLVYRNSGLEFSPNEEMLKKQYEQQLKKFLEIPRQFYGVVDGGSIYAEILTRNTKQLESVNKFKDELFDQLHSVIKHWQSWLQLEPLDTAKLTTWQHWDLHFRASKTFGQEIAKLPSAEERVGCFLIGLSRLRSDLEAHNRSYWDQLVYSLKDSIAQDVVKLQNYVDPSTATLTRQPVTIEEVGESDVAHAAITNELPEMEKTYEEMLKKSQILASWSHEYVDAVNRLKGAWGRLQSLLENHQHIIAKQMETIKTTLNIECENLEKEIERFSAKFEQVKPKLFNSDATIEDLSKQFREIQARKVEFEEILTKKQELLGSYKKFNLEEPEISYIDAVEIELKKEEESWRIFDEFYSELESLLNEFWIVIRKKLHVFDDFLVNWQTKLKGNCELVTKILQEIQKFEVLVPVLKYVKGEDFTEKHWMTVFNLLGMEQKPVDQLLLKDFIAVGAKLEVNSKELQILCKKAASEIVVRQALSELDQWEVQSRFIFTNHTDSYGKNLVLIKDYKEILNKIGDNQSLLQSIKNSADYESFAERANLWETKLGDLDLFLMSLSQIQRKWIYLEPIFGGGTLVQEKSRFDRIDRDFRNILTFTEKDPRVVMLCRYPNLRSVLESIQDQLGRCQNSLDNFLLEKRNKFPRFLFLSDDDLLEVVGQSSKEQVIQTHLKKIFAGIHGIELSGDGASIVAMCSLQGERVVLNRGIVIRNIAVEDWLNVLIDVMQNTLKELLVECLNEKQAPDPLKYPSQILCLAANINFTTKCEQAITTMTLPPLLAKYKSQLSYYSSQELSDDENDDTVVLELKLKALLLDTIHHINILKELLDCNATKIGEWVWQKQLRYYSNGSGDVTVKMANASLDYSFEYLGNAAKLVRTPLTERCFLTLTQGMHLGMGGNPYGPAGTGKTESVKALGGLLGRQVLVFNCDEGVDAASMGRILSGLVRSGAWGCFDEFNRLDEATLSAVSMLIQPIQTSLKSNSPTVKLLDQEISVNKHCGIFVTLNPAGGGYGGRNKLPDNLKQLFRPVVMTHPDHEEIARSLLLCDGYHSAEIIAKKLVEIFEMSNKLLSKQQHYDWGLRAIRTILTGCSRALKRTKTRTPEVELGLVVKVLRTDTLSKLTFSDSVKFDEIVRNTFKHVSFENAIDNDILAKSIRESFDDLGLIYNERQMSKCLELYEQLKQRMGIAIVGPPSSGKSAIRNLLFRALSKMNRIVKQYCFNPKSMVRNQLLGQIDLDTKQWSDGVLTNYSLQVAAEPSEIWSWIVCDGDVDPEWVESLNSVLDDNRLLSLPSGWRIQFGPNVNFLFETHDLAHASPATISRMGIVFLNEEDLDVEIFVRNYVKSGEVVDLINDYFLRALNWIVNDGEITITCSKIAVAKTGLSQLLHVRNKSQFVVDLINGLGQQLQYDFREFFAQQVYEWTGEAPPALLLKSRYNKERDLIDVYYTNPNLTVENVRDGVPLILTGQVLQILDILRRWLGEKSGWNFVIVGPHGSAKTLILKHLVTEQTDLEMVTIHCSSNLSPNFIINKLQQHCISVNTHKGKIYKPKRGKLLLYFKNLHLLEKDKWGTNILIEFLNQIITYNGFYDCNIEFVGLENVMIVGSLISASNLSTRFTSNVFLCNTSLPERDDLIVIILSYLLAILKETFPAYSWPKAKVAKIVGIMIGIYDQIRSTFTAMQFKHYVFTPHDLVKWCSNLMNCKNAMENGDYENFLIEILSYEALRLFGDKLGTSEDYSHLCTIINDTFQTNYGISNILSRIIDTYFVPTPQQSSFLSKLTKAEWISMVKLGILQCERDGQNLNNILVTEELLELTSKISKSILTNRCGNVLLIGRSGIGRRTALKIISALQSAKIVTLSCDYFKNDLKSAMQSAGIDGEEIYLLIEDHILANQDNLNFINFLISSGEIPGLYTTVELDSLVKSLKEESDRANFEGDLIQFYSERIRCKLHVVLCLDVNNENLWRILQTCPSLVQDTTMIWKTSWSRETLEQIPKQLIESTEKIKPNEGFYKIYNLLDVQFVAPSRYISMIHLYKKIFLEKLDNICLKQNKLNAGVSKLTDASNLVKELKEKAAVQQDRLAEKQAKANAALDMISTTMKNASSHKEEMEVLKSKTEQENLVLKRRKGEIEKELAEVEPLIQEARSAVGNIKSESLSEIRSLRAPPEIIRDILEGVLRLMGIQDTSWNSMKTFLAKRGVKEEIRSFDASRITSDNRKQVERLITTKGDSFDSKAAKRASTAAAPLAAWVMANVKYSHVLDKIRPLETEQNKLKLNLKNAESQLGELSTGLSEVDVTVGKLKEQLSAYTKEAAEIEIDLNKAQETLATAEGLVLQLNDEYERWREQLKEFSVQIDNLSDNCLLGAAVATYLSSETENRRQKLLEVWRNEIGGIPSFSFEEFMVSERDQMVWQSEGLSSDKLSIQNAIIINTHTELVPLLIDPTSTAINWMKNHLKHKNVETTTLNSPKFKNTLELAVRFGKTFIIEEIEYISSLLLPILRNEFVKQGERKLVKLNGKLMDFHNDFKLILCSRNEHLKLPADVQPLINVMNFIVTHVGLTEQLLSAAIQQENPELQERRKQLLREKEELQEKQYRFQNQLLEDLATSTGDILQNRQLMNSLNVTKESSKAITEALKESTEIQSKLQTEYDVFRSISDFGSTLYFACNEFSRYNVVYVISVGAFTRLFLKSLQTFQNFDNKIELQHKHLFCTLYEFMSRAIFKNDRLKFALHLIHKMFPMLITNDEWNLLLGNVMVSSNQDSNLPAWIPKHSVLALQQFEMVLPEIYKNLRLNEIDLWNNFMNTNECEGNFPGHCNGLSEFQKVLVVQVLRTDRLWSMMSQCVKKITGLKSVDPTILELTQINREAIASEPILLLTTSGSDPSSEIRQLRTSEYIEIAMGEGQETKALQALQTALKSGQWLILKNLHLVTSWLTVLCQNLKNVEIHDNFRLWLISEATPNFNFVLAQNSLKIVYEPPQGLRSNLQRNFVSFGSDLFSKLNSTSARIFFIISYLHALLQERRKYIPQGWSKWYEFSDSDFATWIKLVEELWNGSSKIPWRFIAGLCTEAVYGGRIENADDMKILYSYTKEYLTDDVLSHRWRPPGLVSGDLPNSSQFQEYLNSIKQFPAKDAPNFFGLPENIDRSWEKQTSLSIINDLKSIYLSKNILSENFDRQTFHRSLSPFMTLWKKLNQGHDFIRTSTNVEKREEFGFAVQNFIVEEFVGAINLVQFIHKSFTNLNKVCKGILLPGEQELIVGNSLIRLKTPESWMKLWKGSRDPNQYLRTIIGKTVILVRWKEEGNAVELLKRPLKLTCFFHPEALLASHKQDYSKNNNISLDELVLQTSWKPYPNENCLTLTDLLIEGALFDGTSLKSCKSSSDHVTNVPNCYLTWRKKTEIKLRDEKTVEIPVYTASNREDALFSIQMEVDEREKEKWIQTGVCFYLEN